MAPRYRTFDKPYQVDRVRAELRSRTPALVYFYREGCMYCRAMAPAWSEFLAERPPYRVLTVEEQAIPPELNRHIQSFPTVASWVGGTMGRLYEGDRSPRDFRRFGAEAVLPFLTTRPRQTRRRRAPRESKASRKLRRLHQKVTV